MPDVKKFLSEQDQQQIISAIQDAENQTSGEIRVHLENYCKQNVLDRAANVFTNLKMHETDKRNGVLIYLAVKDQKFAIIGDQGIDSTVPEDFWESTKNIMRDHFKHGRFVDGLVDGIKRAGQELKLHFPVANNDRNELPDDISAKDN